MRCATWQVCFPRLERDCQLPVPVSLPRARQELKSRPHQRNITEGLNPSQKVAPDFAHIPLHQVLSAIDDVAILVAEHQVANGLDSIFIICRARACTRHLTTDATTTTTTTTTAVLNPLANGGGKSAVWERQERRGQMPSARFSGQHRSRAGEEGHRSSGGAGTNIQSRRRSWRRAVLGVVAGVIAVRRHCHRGSQ